MARTRTAERRGASASGRLPKGSERGCGRCVIAAGLTQAELGGERFTKEYVSQVELGKTKPSDAAMAWLADRLGVERVALEGDGGPSARAACEVAVARAEAAVEARRYTDAVDELVRVRASVKAWP